jgi:hypothetical protein
MTEFNVPPELNHALQAKLLHGEQYLSIKGPIPTEGNFLNETRFVCLASTPSRSADN